MSSHLFVPYVKTDETGQGNKLEIIEAKELRKRLDEIVKLGLNIQFKSIANIYF
jgi:hypothetical protein